MIIANRTIFTADNLGVLRGIDSDTVDLVYLDPPFNSDRDYNVPIGGEPVEQTTHFKDRWSNKDVGPLDHEMLRAANPALHEIVLAGSAAGGVPTMSYLLYMAPRLLEMKRVLKPTGSIFYHLDPKESHAVKLMMDVIFGRANFRNEIIWGYPPKGNGPKLGFHRKHDVILYYGKTDKGVFHRQYTALNDKQKAKFSFKDKDGRLYKDFKGRRSYLDESNGRPVPSWWDDIPVATQSRKEYVGFQTQKSVKLLERIIKAASNEGDFVLDPFCGCATTMIAAERLGRQWAGIDLSATSVRLLRQRMEKQLGLGSVGMFDIVANEDVGWPERSDLGKLKPPAYWKNHLYDKQHGHCKGCGEYFFKKTFHIDHIIPKKWNGTAHLSNLQLLCPTCNGMKAAGKMSDLMRKLREERGF